MVRDARERGAAARGKPFDAIASRTEAGFQHLLCVCKIDGI